MKITATIITLNEEKNIRACLESLDFVAEIIVLDSGSTDRTPGICQGEPRVRFVQKEWHGFGRQKNMAAELATSDWILNVDADERVSPELRSAVLAADFDRFEAFRVARRNHFGTRWIRRCGWYPDYNLRLYDRRRCSFSEREVHEAVVCTGMVGELAGDLFHYTYAGISDYVTRMDRYSTLAAGELVKSGRGDGCTEMIFRPAWTFFRMYFLKYGFLEGHAGLLLSLLYAQYTFLKYAKARELSKSGND